MLRMQPLYRIMPATGNLCKASKMKAHMCPGNKGLWRSGVIAEWREIQQDLSANIPQTSFNSDTADRLVFRGRWLVQLEEPPHLLDDSLLMMSLSGIIEFRSLHFCSIRHDWVRETRSRRTLNKSLLTYTDLEKDSERKKNYRKEDDTDEHFKGGVYLSKLCFNDVKLDLLVDCPGDVVPFERLWVTKKNLCRHTNSAALYSLAEVLTFYTDEFVLPLLGGAPGQSSGLTDRNHQTVPPAWEENQNKPFSQKQTGDNLPIVAG